MLNIFAQKNSTFLPGGIASRGKLALDAPYIFTIGLAGSIIAVLLLLFIRELCKVDQNRSSRSLNVLLVSSCYTRLLWFTRYSPVSLVLRMRGFGCSSLRLLSNNVDGFLSWRLLSETRSRCNSPRETNSIELILVDGHGWIDHVWNVLFGRWRSVVSNDLWIASLDWSTDGY